MALLVRSVPVGLNFTTTPLFSLPVVTVPPILRSGPAVELSTIIPAKAVRIADTRRLVFLAMIQLLRHPTDPEQAFSFQAVPTAFIRLFIYGTIRRLLVVNRRRSPFRR